MQSFYGLMRRMVGGPARLLAVVGLVVVGGLGTAAVVGAQTSGAPANTASPTISGTAAVGSTLTASMGTWSGGAPISYAYQWQMCNAGGSACSDLAGATAQTFQIPGGSSGDQSYAGNTIRVDVSSTNSDGTSSALSAPTTAIAASTTAPVNTSQPVITGTASVGSTLTASDGGWSGTTPITFQFQWQSCSASGQSCGNIAGATAQSYVIPATEAGDTLRVNVTAVNAEGSTPAPSATSSEVTAAPIPPTGCPNAAAGDTVAVSAVSLPARLQVAQSGSVATLTAATQSFTVSFHVTDTCGQPVSGAEVYATTTPFNQFSAPTGTTDGSGNVTLTFSRDSGFPADLRQQLLVMFVRATQPGQSPLAGISTHRLIALNVDLKTS